MTTPESNFPTHPTPRTWLITAATSPLGLSVARAALAHGDSIIAGVKPSDIDTESERGDDFREFYAGECMKEGWRERIRRVRLDGRCEGPLFDSDVEAVGKGRLMQGGGTGIWDSVRLLSRRLWRLSGGWTFFFAARAKVWLARTGASFGFYSCLGVALVGTVEELAASPRTQSLVRDQFETNFFGPVNTIKAAIPAMRRQGTGHIIILTGITGHLGTPGLGMHCASWWALEGFCDSLAYEIAPFNIKMTILQPTIEIGILTNKIVSAPLLPQYDPENNSAPLFRNIIVGLLDQIQNAQSNGNHEGSTLAPNEISTLYPNLPEDMKTALLAETINAITAIGGHENPPARHIVGHEGVASVKEKLKTVSEELEDFVEVSCAVDIGEADGTEDSNAGADGETSP